MSFGTGAEKTPYKKHAHKTFENMIKHRQNTWSTIVQKPCQTIPKNLVKHRQTHNQQIVKKHGQQQLKHMVKHRSKTT
jgi:hypothetical protein